MPIFQLTSPEGQKYRITAPDGATEEDAFNQLQQHLGTPPPTAAPEEPSALKSVVRKAVEYLAPNVAAKYPVGEKRPFELPPSIAGVRDIVRGAQPLAMDFTKGEASTEQVPQLMETAALGLSAPAGSVLGRTAGAARGTRPPLAPEAPTAIGARDAARDIYRPIDRMAPDTPLPEGAGGGLREHIAARLRAENKTAAEAPRTYEVLNNIGSATNVGELVNARRALGKVGPTEIGDLSAIPEKIINEAIDRHLPIDRPSERLATADQNWNAFRVAQGLDKNINKAELQTAGAASGTNLGNKLRQMATQIATNDRRTRYMQPDEIKSLVDLGRGSAGQDFARSAGNLMGAGHGIQGGMWGMGALMTGHPELLTPILAGKLLRSGYNRSVANQAGQLSQRVLMRSPEYRARLAAHEQEMARWRAANPH